MRGCIQRVVAYHIDFPRDRAVAQHADTNRRRLRGARRHRGSSNRGSSKSGAHQRAARDAHQAFLPFVRAIIPASIAALSMGWIAHCLSQSVSASLPIENTAPAFTATPVTTQLRPVLSVNLTS